MSIVKIGEGLSAAAINISSLLDRNLFSMSGGEKQKIACASAAAIEEILLSIEADKNEEQMRND